MERVLAGMSERAKRQPGILRLGIHQQEARGTQTQHLLPPHAHAGHLGKRFRTEITHADQLPTGAEFPDNLGNIGSAADDPHPAEPLGGGQQHKRQKQAP